MALETVFFPQDPFGCYSGKELYGLLGDGGGGGGNISAFFDDFEVPLDFDNSFLDSSMDRLDGSSGGSGPGGGQLHMGDQSSLSPYPNYSCSSSQVEVEAAVVGERPKRRRGKSKKNKEDIENQRMTHIAVERNRRKQMNEYLSVLRSLMPDSYVQRGDQASIIGGAINFVKELEQQLHILGARKQFEHPDQGLPSDPIPLPFSDCFTVPQYSSIAAVSHEVQPATIVGEVEPAAAVAAQPNEVADIEVTMVESHANMKIRSKRRPKQLLRLVSGLQALRLTVLHLNVSTIRQVVLYSLSLKVEDDCKLTTVDEIASAVYRILVRIQEEAGV
ncbi:transcription factor bHLH94-like [Punica granatum]|uniref:BHLH domain-containing protein n=2 Tax=Punica granatum TaxID=22663 RepID=A0A218XL19_PUNGR|nr:transcription factor bHLH94-like [Punica granatum]OWM85386.1 hypothetical protein CDL15_Pgr019010 [Punica granatum]PKI74092.1 hypothetical protein CRG98_005570 [Punica granatum]